MPASSKSERDGKVGHKLSAFDNGFDKELIDSLSHDLRSPLLATTQTLDLIIGGSCGEINDEVAQLLILLKDNNEDVLCMVHALLDMARFSLGTDAPTLSEANIQAMIEACAFSLRSLAEAKQISLTAGDTSGTHLILLDCAWTEKMFFLLLRNCLSHGQSGGNLHIICEDGKEDCVVTISTNGLGIPREDFVAVFSEPLLLHPFKAWPAAAKLELKLCATILAAQSAQIDFCGDEQTLSIKITFPRSKAVTV